MPDDDQPKPDAYYQQQLEASLSASRAERQRAENLTVAQRSQVLAPSIPQATAAPSSVSVLGALGSGGKSVLPGRHQPPLPVKTATAVVSPNQFTLSVSGTTIQITIGMVGSGGSVTFASGVGPYPDVFTNFPNSTSSPGPYVFTPTTGTGFAWLHDTITPASSTVTGLTIGCGSTVPTQTETDGYEPIGSWSMSGSTITILTGSIGTGNGLGQLQLDYDDPQHYYSPAGSGTT